MPNGLYGRLTGWISESGPYLIILIFLCFFATTVTQAQDVSQQVETLRAEMARLRQTFPHIPYLSNPSPSPEEIEKAARISSREGRALLEQAMEKLNEQAEVAIKRRLVDEGALVRANPTSSSTYSARRTLLLETAAFYERRGIPLRGLFPQGLPSRFLPAENAAERNFRYCDESITHLAGLFRHEVESLTSHTDPSGESPVDTAAPDSGVQPSTSFAPDPASPRPSSHRVPTLERDPTERRSTWALFAYYATYSVYILGTIALLGILFHALSGARGAFKAATVTEKGTLDLESVFKESLTNFQKQRYAKALEGFGLVAGGDGDEATRARYYSVLTLLRLDDTHKARAQLKFIDSTSLSTDELYRLGCAFEEADDSKQGLELFEQVRSRDQTFRDVLHRIALLKKKTES